MLVYTHCECYFQKQVCGSDVETSTHIVDILDTKKYLINGKIFLEDVKMSSRSTNR